MYLEFLVEDSSGKAMLEILIPLIAPQLTINENYTIHPHKGISHLKKKLPMRLSSFAKQYSYDKQAYIFVICDSDDKCPIQVKAGLEIFLDKCNPKPRARLCIAVEEMEAWLLGDKAAILKAYPRAKKNILNGYVQDSACNTWELLADATCPKGRAGFAHYVEAGTQKHEWAENICPHMDIRKNISPSFNYFKTKILNIVNSSHVTA